MAQRVGTAAPTYTLVDHLGSTRYTLDGSGSKTAEMRYYPWGSTQYSSNPGDTPRRQFTGQMNDGDTGLYYYNARYYEPGLARFVQADTIVPNSNNPQTFNRYSYVYNNPLNWIDSNGHEPRPPQPGYTVTQYIYSEMMINSRIPIADSLREEIQRSNMLMQGAKSVGKREFETFLTAAAMISRGSAWTVWTIQVAPGQDWDHKPMIIKSFSEIDGGNVQEVNGSIYRHDLWSNIHYGYVGLSLGFNSLELLQGAGLAQFAKSKIAGEAYYDAALQSGEVGPHTFYDWPEDAKAIFFGMYLYEKYGMEMTYEQFMAELETFSETFEQPNPETSSSP